MLCLIIDRLNEYPVLALKTFITNHTHRDMSQC